MFVLHSYISGNRVSFGVIGSFIGGREREEEEVSVLEIGLGVGEKEGSMQ